MPPSIQKKRDPSCEDPSEQLCNAAQQGDGAAVARLLAAGADPNASVPCWTPSGEAFNTTALCMAAHHGRLEAARLLLDDGADPSHAAGDGADDRATPLISAAGTGRLEVLRLLLARGAAVDAVLRGPGMTAFHSACCGNQAECAEALARAGCDVGIKTIDGLTGRQFAEQQGNVAVVQRLRTVGAEQPPVGAVARIHSLVGAPEHNGQRAAVRRHLPAKGRFELELLESGQKISVKPANFELVAVPVGLAVEVHGLVGAAEHNGKQGVVESRVAAGLGRIVALHHPPTNPLHTRITNISGASVSEATMRPNPRSGRTGAAACGCPAGRRRSGSSRPIWRCARGRGRRRRTLATSCLRSSW
jgi:hypothetical protein